MQAPDSPTPIRGYRVWGVSLQTDRLRLRSTASGFLSGMPRWEPRTRFVGSCLAAEPCRTGIFPDPDHGCGIYAVARAEDAEEWGWSMAKNGPIVIGEVLLWGTVIGCSTGWRGSYAYPASLSGALPPRTFSRRRTQVPLEELGVLYGVPVTRNNGASFA